MERLKELLRISGLPESALAFDVFVPKGWDAPAPSVSEKKPDYRDALAHVRRVRVSSLLFISAAVLDTGDVLL